MKKSALARFLPILALAAIGQQATANDTAALQDEARKTAGMLVQTLGGELKGALAAGGPAAAIGVCKEKAPKIAAEAAQKTGFKIKRVSPNNRNPKAVPDAWETAALADLDKRLAAGEKAETLDMNAVVEGKDGKVFRYAKALVTQPLCVTCHGPADQLSAEVKAKLAAEYPNDKAVGYAPGMIRGILSMQKPL